MLRDLILDNWIIFLVVWLPVGYLTARIAVKLLGYKIETRSDAILFFCIAMLGWFALYLIVVFLALGAVIWSGFFLWLVLGRPAATWIKNRAVSLGNLFANTCWRFAPK